MKRLMFALGLLALTYAAPSPARADFAVVRFEGGWCRVWVDTAQKPWGGEFLWWHHHHHWHWWHHRHWWHHHWWHHGWHYSLPTWESADAHLHRAWDWHRCHP